MAAKTRFTPETRAALLQSFAAGCTIGDAAKAVKPPLATKTLRSWLARGRRESDTDYARFVLDVEKARQSYRERPDPMDAEELKLRVSESARAGNTQAMRLMHDILETERKRAAEKDEPADPLASFDELAAKRAARAS